MPAVNEPSSRPVPVRKSRFSLSALLLAPLVLSPLFLALRDSYTLVTQLRHGENIMTLLFGFVYALILTLISYRRKIATGTMTAKRPFVWSLVHGALFGLLYFSLVWLPVWITEQIVVYKRPRPLVERIEFFAWGFAAIALLGVVFGGAAGGILGLFWSRCHATDDERS
jgi:hypothetical protein